MKRKSFIRSSFLKKAFPLFSVLCLSLLSLPVFAQTKITVSGVVTDSSGQPVPGVTVWAPALNVASLTEPDGSYSITLTSDRVEIHFDCMGYVSQTFIVTGSRGLNVSLADEAMVLENAVVVGYGTQRKETVTGSVTAVATKDLLQSPQANISNALAGRMPGLLAVQRSGEPGKDASTLRIRGVGTFAGGQDPLIMVDGIESSNYNNIDPNEIESVSILKDASATAVYGVRGANGVLLITTKRGQVGKPKVSLSTNVALSNFPFLRENMNSYEYAKSLNEAYAYDSYITGNYTQRYTDAQVEKVRIRSSIRASTGTIIFSRRSAHSLRATSTYAEARRRSSISSPSAISLRTECSRRMSYRMTMTTRYVTAGTISGQTSTST